jgi:holliday junction DNA helicase RuvA
VIGRLRGTLVERGEDSVVVDCGGVGYDVTVSAVTHAALPAGDSEVTLRVYTHVMETRIALYGFATDKERRLFDLLITVKNVGPSTAVGILSGAPPEELARTIAAADIKALVKIRGVGKKTAELIVVELKDKCEFLLATWGAAPAGEVPRPAVQVTGPRSPLLDDVASALVNFGWRAAEVDKIVAKLPVASGATVESLLREALRVMPR